MGAVDAHRIIRRVVAHQGLNAQQVEVPLSRWVERASQPQADSATSKSRHWPADAMTANTAPLVTREALQAFTQRLVKHFAPEQVILFGSQARGEARWNSDADILVVMPFEGLPDALCPGDGGPVSNANATPGARVHTPTRNPVVNEWIARAERHWRMAEQMADPLSRIRAACFWLSCAWRPISALP